MNVYKVFDEGAIAVVVAADDRTAAQEAAKRVLGDVPTQAEIVLDDVELTAGVSGVIARHVEP